MHFLTSISPLSREGLTLAATIVASLIALWLCGMFSRRRFVVLKRSEETELISHQLRRIADAVERLASAKEPSLPADAPAERRVSASIFGR